MASMAWVQGAYLTGGVLLRISLCKALTVAWPTCVTHVCGSRRWRLSCRALS